MIMTGLFENIANDEEQSLLALRKATAVTRARVESVYGSWLRKDPSRISHIEDEIRAIAAHAAEEHGVEDIRSIADVVLGAGWTKDADCGKDHSKLPWKDDDEDEDDEDEKKTSSVKESRKPKMCPFHKDVVEISLNAGDPTAGYSALQSHWGGNSHCESGSYEGGKCNFKPAMTTQSFWDERAEKAEQRRQERQEQLNAIDEHLVDEGIVPDDSTDIDENIPSEITEPVSEGGELVQFPSSEPSAIGTGIEEVPMSMAAKVAGNGNCENCGKPLGNDTGTYCKSCGEEKTSSEKLSEYKYVKKHGDKWVIIQKGTGKVLSTHDSEEKAKASFRAMEMNMHGGSTKTAEDNLGGDGTPSPKIDKRLWTPKTVPPLTGVDDDSGRNPTRHQDTTEAIEFESSNNGDLKDIGESVTERVDVTQDKAQISQPGGSTWTGTDGQANPVTSSSLPNDPDKNPIVALIDNEYDGFLPESVVQSAISSHKK